VRTDTWQKQSVVTSYYLVGGRHKNRCGRRPKRLIRLNWRSLWKWDPKNGMVKDDKTLQLPKISPKVRKMTAITDSPRYRSGAHPDFRRLTLARPDVVYH